jgi:hypothetical protein
MGTCRGRAHVILVAANANGRVHCRRHRPCVGRRGLSPKARLIFVASPINTRFALLDIFCAASHPYAAISECACWRLRKIQLRAQRDNATAEAEAVARSRTLGQLKLRVGGRNIDITLFASEPPTTIPFTCLGGKLSCLRTVKMSSKVCVRSVGTRDFKQRCSLRWPVTRVTLAKVLWRRVSGLEKHRTVP